MPGSEDNSMPPSLDESKRSLSATSLLQHNHDTLTRIKCRLDDQETKLSHDFHRFKGIKSAVTRIVQNDSAYMDSPDIVKAQTTLEERPYLEEKLKGHTAAEALRLLKEGNATFLRDEVQAKQSSGRHIALHFAQKPHAVIIACSDSRVPPEMVFNQGFGDLFVIRLAGNTVDSLARASLLYAVLHLGSPLVVVMGHEKCGAVTAALQPAEAHKDAPKDIQALVTNISKGISCDMLGQTAEIDDEKLLCAVVCNVHSVVQSLQEHPDIHPLIQEGKLSVVGSYFSFNGVVSFFDEDLTDAAGTNGNSSICMSCSGHVSGSNSPGHSHSPAPSPVFPLANGVGKSV